MRDNVNVLGGIVGPNDLDGLELGLNVGSRLAVGISLCLVDGITLTVGIILGEATGSFETDGNIL